MFVKAGTGKWHVLGTQHEKGTVTGCGSLVKAKEFSEKLDKSWLGNPHYICGLCFMWWGEEYQKAAS